MLILPGVQEDVRALIAAPQRDSAVPGPYGDVGDRIIRTRDIFAVSQTAVEDVQLALGFHGVAVDRIFDLLGSVGKEMAEAAAEEGCAAHLPEQPRQGLGPRGTCGRQEFAELLRKVEQDRARFENAHRLRTTA